MGHTHIHNQTPNIGRAFKTGIAINILFIIAETFFGIASNSMALVADAGHNFSDVLALIFSWVAIALSGHKPTAKFTYGYRRSTILVALLNTILLLIAVGVIIWETVARLSHPVGVKSGSVIIVAVVGIVVNGVTAWLLNIRKDDLNVRSSFVHFIADALVSLGVVVAGVIMVLTGITWVDSIVSFVIAAVILYSSYHLLIDSLNLALDAVPGNINIGEVRAYLESLPEVASIHDLHVWALSTTDVALTVHLSTREQTDISFITSIQHQLNEQFKIGHTTIQVEHGVGNPNCDINCF
jgi:cobalt-zinc-cadmium efflux system protein